MCREILNDLVILLLFDLQFFIHSFPFIVIFSVCIWGNQSGHRSEPDQSPVPLRLQGELKPPVGAVEGVHDPAPVPVVRQPVVTPIVKKTSKPVTYTHLGAHPIQPTTVFEETQEVVGHQFF